MNLVSLHFIFFYGKAEFSASLLHYTWSFRNHSSMLCCLYFFCGNHDTDFWRIMWHWRL